MPTGLDSFAVMRKAEDLQEAIFGIVEALALLRHEKSTYWEALMFEGVEDRQAAFSSVIEDIGIPAPPCRVSAVELAVWIALTPDQRLECLDTWVEGDNVLSVAGRLRGPVL